MRRAAPPPPSRRTHLAALRRLLSPWLVALQLSFAPAALANPQGENVVHGEASFERSGSELGITVSDGGIIEWQSFDVAPEESVRFHQPGEWARVMNRVRDVKASRIDGSLYANGQVYILNPFGVYVGDTAVVDVGRLVTIAGSLSNEDFLAGRDHFTDLSGAVVNEGEIFADAVTLVGRSVANRGRIVANEGDLLLVAGDEVWVRQYGSPIRIRVAELDRGIEGAAVTNEGSLTAERGAVQLAAGDWLGHAVHTSGAIRAREIALEGGANGAVTVSGTLDASDAGEGGRGGEIRVTGDRVALLGAELDASGAAGGGRIRIGGDVQGGGPLPNASATVVDAGSRIRADATRRGDGGDVVVWADDYTRVDGEISVRGGPEGGDGGFVETSGKQRLDVSRAPDLAAPAGRGGSWLIDPTDVDIIDPADFPPGSPDVTDAPDGLLLDPELDEPDFAGLFVPRDPERNTLSADAIHDAVVAGGDVTVTTRQFADRGQADGDIRLLTAILFTAADDETPTSSGIAADTEATLTLRAANHITVEPGTGIDNTSQNLTLSLALLANDDNRIQNGLLSQPAAPAAGDIDNRQVGDVRVYAPLRTGGGDVTLGGVNIEVVVPELDAGGDPIVDTDGRFVPLGDGSGGLVPAIETGGGSVLMVGGSAGGSPLVGVGGNVDVDSPIRTGGEEGAGYVDAIAFSSPTGETDGRIRIDAAIDTRPEVASATGEGGVVQLEADREITLTENASVATDHGDVVIAPVLASPFLPPTLELDAPVSTAGGVFFAGVSGDELVDVAIGQISQSELPLASATIGETASIDTLDPTPDASDTDAQGIRVRTLDDLVVESPAQGVALPDGASLRGALVSLRAGIDGEGDLRLDVPAEGGMASQPFEIHADELELAAGDGFTTPPAEGEEPEGRGAGVELGGALFRNLARDGAPATIRILQDADLSLVDLADRLPAGADLAGGDLVFAAADGTLTLPDPTLFDETTLRLVAADGLAFGAGPPASPASLQSLDVEIAGDLLLDDTFAGAFEADEIEISAGDPFDVDGLAPGFAGTLTVADGVTLATRGGASRITLHGGATAGGDLVFSEGTLGTELVADSITLRAGDGENGVETSRVELRPDVRFVRRSAGGPYAFTLRQDAGVTSADLPARSAFLDENEMPLDGLRGVTYRVRSDDGPIDLDVDDRDALLESDLELFAFEDVRIADDTPDTGPDALDVASADVGGTAAFTVVQDLVDRIRVEDGGRLTLRSGLESRGDLRFADGVTVPGHRIRLVAGDGAGGGTASGIRLRETGGTPSFDFGSAAAPELVLRQDASIEDGDLPLSEQLAGENLDALTLVARSDDGAISLADLEGLAPADRTILDATSVSISRTDGMDLDLRNRELEIRSDAVTFNAITSGTVEFQGDDGAEPPEVLANAGADVLRLAGFETEVEEIDLGPPPATSPDLFRLVQDGDLDGSNVPLAEVFQGGLDAGASDGGAVAYELQSSEGSIVVDDGARDAVAGSRLALLIPELPAGDPDAETPEDVRSVDFDVTELDVDDLLVEVANQLEVDGDGSLTISADDGIELASGTSGGGDLHFGENVVLEAEQITLRAGDGRTLGEDSAPPIVDTRRSADGQELSDAPLFAFRDGEDVVNRFEIEQDGRALTRSEDFSSTPELEDALREKVNLEANLPTAEQLARASDDGSDPVGGTGLAVLEEYVVASSDEEFVISSDDPDLEGIDLGDQEGRRLLPIEILDVGDFAADSLALDSSSPGGGVRVASTDGDLDLTDPDREIGLRGDAILLDAGSPGASVLAGSDGLRFERPLQSTEIAAGRSTSASPFEFRITQDAAFTGDSLPRPRQFAQGLTDFLFLVIGGQVTLVPYAVDYVLSSNATTAFTVEPTLVERVEDASLTLEARSQVVFDSLDDAVLSLASLDVRQRQDAGAMDPFTIALGAKEIRTEGSQRYQGDVMLTNDVTLVGDDVLFAGEAAEDGGVGEAVDVRSDAGGPERELTIVASDLVHLSGDVGVGGDGAELAALRILLNEDGGGGQPRVEIGREGDFARTVRASGEIAIGAAREVDAAPGTAFVLDEDGRDSVPATATVFLRGMDPSEVAPGEPAAALAFETDGAFSMGSGEKLSVPGTVSVTAERARLGDVSALELEVVADSIEVVRRARGSALGAAGGIGSDGGVDIVANEVRFHDAAGNPVVPVAVGSGRGPVFGVPRLEDVPSFLAGFPIAAISPHQSDLSAASFSLDGTVFDLRPAGPSRNDLTEALPPDLVPQPDAAPRPPLRLADAGVLRTLGLRARPMTRSERRSELAGAAILDDVRAQAARRPVTVSLARVQAGAADEAVAAYERVFGAGGERAPEVRATLQEAIDAYRSTTGARRVIGFEARRFVRNRPSTQIEAYRALESLEALLRYHRALGLAPSEYERIQAGWLAAVKPDGISPEEFAEMVHPSRYVRGSDVLDVFGR